MPDSTTERAVRTLDLFADALTGGERASAERAVRIYRELRDSGALDHAETGCSCSKAEPAPGKSA